MTRLQELHPDQQAVLQLVLRRRMGYAEIGGLLGLAPDAVRERALDAVDGLAPDDVPGLELTDRDRIADLLLGQGSAEERAATRELLLEHAPARGWATTVATELDELGGPVEAVPGTAAAEDAAGAPDPDATTAPEPSAGGGAVASGDSPVPAAAAAAAAAPAAAGGSGDVRDAFAALDEARAAGAGNATTNGPATTRKRPTALALASGALALVLVAVVIAFVTGAFRSDDDEGSDLDAAAPATTTTGESGAAADAQQFLSALPRQINFRAPVGAQAPYADVKGVAQSTLSQTTGEPVLALTTEGVPKASKNRRYFAWADKSGADPILIGQLTDARGAELPFTGVDLKTRQAAAVDPTVYNRIRITRQTASAPTKPGPTVLVGTLRTRAAN